MDVEPRNPTPGSAPPGEPSPWALAGLGMQFFASILLFVYAGNWLDRRFDSSPLCLLVGLFVGGGGTFYASYRRLMKPVTSRSTHDTDSLPKP
ncbi:AtpZ/AtpI family protein [Gemmatimonas sp.]|uniref:AtpZ/AtpI family protein n=2 Tax=Gemmatimonas sp. TaxID=1962908 RepID=UPI003563C386